MGVPSGSETGFAVLELESGGRLSGDIVFEDGWTQGYEDAVMAVMVHQRGLVGRDFQLEHPHIIILQGEMMVRLFRDFDRSYIACCDLACGGRDRLRGGQDGGDKQWKEKLAVLHGARF
jgi:hypothetical protein